MSQDTLNPSDQIDAAIAAVDQPEQPEMRQFAVTIASTGRQAAVMLPVDASDAEIAEFCGWVLTAVLNTHRAERGKSRSGILLPMSAKLIHQGDS